MKNKWLWIGLGIFGLVVVLFIVIGISAFSMFKSLSKEFTGPNSPQNTIETQLKDLKKGDYTSAYALFSNVEKSTVTPAGFKKFVSTNPTISNYKTDKFSINIVNDQATYNGTITGGRLELYCQLNIGLYMKTVRGRFYPLLPTLRFNE